MGGLSFGFCFDTIKKIAASIESIRGTQIAIVVGGGNIMRGALCSQMDRTASDQIGMLATVINSIALHEMIPDCVVMCSRRVHGTEEFCAKRARQYLEKGKKVICSGGTGAPFFTTDTAAILRACELSCDLVIKGSMVDGVYCSDPKKNNAAVKFQNISYDEILAKRLQVMDLTAITMAMENKIPLMVCSIFENLSEVLADPGKFTLIS